MEEDFDKYCNDIVQNFFPDCIELRALCRRAGYLPPKHRAELWNLLLSSSLLQNDSEIVEGKSSATDIVNLFCKRTNKPVISVISHILESLIASSTPMDLPKASSCLYTFSMCFLPLFLLTDDSVKSKSQRLVTDKLSTLIRVLVLYHFPLLAAHLGSVEPEWAKIFSFSDINSTCSNLIPNTWIGSLFAGTVLQCHDNILRLWDWCVCLGEKYIGVYLVVALLGLHEKSLRKLTTRQELQGWLKETCSGGMASFQGCSVFSEKIVHLLTCEGQSLSSTNDVQSKDETDSHCISQGGEDKNSRCDEEQGGGDGGGGDDDDDDDDDFPLASANLSMMNDIHLRGERISIKRDPDQAKSRVDAMLSTAWDDDTEQDDECELNYVRANEKEQHQQNSFVDVNTEQLELIFLIGWIGSTTIIIRNTPETYKSTLRNVTEDIDQFLRSRSCEGRYMHSHSESDDDHSDYGALDSTSHGFDIENSMSQEEATEEMQCMDYYEEECGSEYGNSALSSPAASTPGVEKGSSHVMSMLNKGLHIISQKDSKSMSRYNAPQLTTTPRKWLSSGHRHAPCVGTAAEEVLPCICSNRRYDSTRSEDELSGISKAFFDGASFCLHAIDSGLAANALLKECILSLPQCENSEAPFYFAIDCWPQVYAGEYDVVPNRPCKIPKALPMSQLDVMSDAAMDDLLSVLTPIAGKVHVVLIGKGSDLIRCNYGGDPFVTKESLKKNVHEQSAQLGALVLNLAKRGIPYVSILDGGYGSVLRLFWNNEHVSDDEMENRPQGEALNFDFLFDVDHTAINTLFLGSAIDCDKHSSTKIDVSDTEESGLLDCRKPHNDKFKERSSRSSADSEAHSSTSIGDIFASSGSAVSGVAGVLSKKLFSYGK